LRSTLKLVHEVVWQASQCMKSLGNLTIWRAVVDWCLTGSFLQLLSVTIQFNSVIKENRTILK